MLTEKAQAGLRHLGFALRSLRRSPGFTLVAVLTLGLGIGANTTAFSVLNEVFLRPLPYPESERIDRLYRATAQDSRGAFSPADYLDLQSASAAYGDVAAWGFADLSLSAPGEPAELARGLRTSDNLFALLGVDPQLGRRFRAEENLHGNHRVLILASHYWHKRFGGDPQVVGRVVRIDGEPHRIVGVLPPAMDDWRTLGAYDLFRPLALTAEERVDRSSTWLRLAGLRSPGRGREQGDAFLASFGQRLAAAHPAVNAGATWRTLPIQVATAPDNGPGIFAMLIGLSIFVLLIACSNLANLLLARTIARARELALRSAIGASRARLLRPLFVESLLLSLLGGGLALGFAAWANDWLRTRGDMGRFEFAIDWRILGWTCAACLLTALAFGVVPAHFALRLDLNHTLKSGSRSTTADRGHRRFRNTLIVGQFALAMVLLAGAALFVRGAHEANNRRHGWESDHLVIGSIHLPAAAYPSGKEIANFQRLAVERLAALPGVESASLSHSMPFFGLGEPQKLVVAGRQAPAPGREPIAATNAVSPRYFESVRTRVLAGRAFDDRDTLDTPRVLVINQAMAAGLFGTASPIGRRLARAGEKTVEWGEIVGVVDDVESIYPERAAVTYQLYEPLAQRPGQASEIAVRTAGVPPAALDGAIRAAIAGLDADLPVRDLRSAEDAIARANIGWSILGTMLSSLAFLGVALASLGLYGVIARTTAQRTGELAIRLALGALGRDIVRLVVASGARLAIVGSTLGLLGGYGISRLIATFFPAMQSNSAVVLSGVTLLLISVALLACYVPARQASKIDPVRALG